MSRMSGYFFDGSKSGGFTIHPCTFMPSFDVNQISSAWPSVFPVRTSAFTSVSQLMADGVFTLNATTSTGCPAVVITPTAIPFGFIEVTVNS